MTPLRDRVGVVTGGGAGVGQGIALALAAAGATVVVTGRTPNSASSTVEQIREQGGAALGVQCDAAQRDDVQAMVNRTIDAFGRLDIMVCNAAGDLPTEMWKVQDITLEHWESLAGPSIRGTVACAQLALPHFQSGTGRLIVMTSSVAISGVPLLPVYACVKGVQRSLVKSLAREWGPLGITANCIAPLARTQSLERSYNGRADGEQAVLARVPLGRLGDPETDIGPAAVFLASDAGGYVTGQTLFVDGGMFTAP